MAKNRARSIERRYAAITRTLPEVAAARGLGGEVIA